MSNPLFLDIYGFGVELHCSNTVIYNNIKNDFSYFISEKVENSFLISVTESSQDGIIPKNLYPTKQSSNSMTYDCDGIRYNDYYGKALTVLNYSKNQFTIYSQDIDLSYEIIFLIIQSRSGKYLDRKGIHKIHACSFSLKNETYILSLPSKGGKTTTLLELLRKRDIELVSDDSPLVNSKGELLPYPLRIGSENREDLTSLPGVNADDIYEFNRQSFSKKYLLPITSLKNKVGVTKKYNLIFGYRGSFTNPRLKKLNKLMALKNLWIHMIIGIGLPMIIEYFIENTIRDYFVNLKILFSRIRNAIRLVMKADCYSLELSSDIKSNVDELITISKSN